jgi:putative transposase
MNRSTNAYKRHRFPPAIIRYAVWLYHRFNLSHRDIEDLLAERWIQSSYESVRLWCNRFGPLFSGRRHYLWRAVDQDGDVVDVYLQARRNAGH